MKKRLKREIMADIEAAQWEIEHNEHYVIPKLIEELKENSYRLTKEEKEELSGYGNYYLIN